MTGLVAAQLRMGCVSFGYARVPHGGVMRTLSNLLPRSIQVMDARRLALALVVLWVALITGCESASTRSTAPIAEPTAAEKAAKQAQEHAQRLRQAMAATRPAAPETQPAVAVAPVNVQWIDTRPAAATALVSVAPEAATTRPAAEALTPGAVTKPATQPAAPAAAAPAMTRDQLLKQLLAHARSGVDPAMNKALSAVAVSLLSDNPQLDPAALADLDPQRRELVTQYHQLLVTLDAQLRAGKPIRDRAAVDKALAGLTADSTVAIRTVKLCRRVQSFGVYEPLPNTSLLAGREQPAVVYVELDHFRTTMVEGNKHQVRIAQELELFHDADGLIVWRQPRVEISDESLNRRRDFFVVQMIRLPSRLNVGKYRLKVRVTDLANGSTDESTLPIQIVADARLVTEPAPAK